MIRYFRFPIKIYEEPSREDAILNEFRDDEDYDNWVEGMVSIELDDIAGWADSFSEKKIPDRPKEKLFNETIVFTKSIGTFVCPWSSLRFEKELDKFR